MVNLVTLAENNLDFHSVKQIIGERNKVMVYGWYDCHYIAITSALRKNPKMDRVFSYAIEQREFEDRTIERIPYHAKPKRSQHRSCKNGITNLLLENYKRVNEGLDIIPVIFCIDSDDNTYTTDAESITSRIEDLNILNTNSELRRCYKLCCELESSEHEEFQEMALIAKEMFKFVKVAQQGDKAVLLPMPPMWELPDLAKKFKKRKAEWKTELEVCKQEEVAAQDKYGLAKKISEASREKLNTHCSKKTKRNIKHSEEAEKDALEMLKQKQTEIEKLVQSNCSYFAYHSGQWRDSLLKAARNWKLTQF
jgi:hypothetical protein